MHIALRARHLLFLLDITMALEFQHQLSRLDSTSRLQKPIKLSPLPLQVRVATNVLLADEDVGHGALARDAFECVLESGAVLYTNGTVSTYRVKRDLGSEHASRRQRLRMGERGVKHTNLIKLHQKVLCALLAQQRLGGLAVGAVGLGEDDDGVLVDDILCLGLCGGHGGRCSGGA
jgi:hypothetical protein